VRGERAVIPSECEGAEAQMDDNLFMYEKREPPPGHRWRFTFATAHRLRLRARRN
jgi:hypothetical protein